MNKQTVTVMNGGMSKHLLRRRATDAGPRLVAKNPAARGRAKVLEFSRPGAEATGRDRRQSLSSLAGVSDAERWIALATGALVVPAVWAGHALLAWMHVL